MSTYVALLIMYNADGCDRFQAHCQGVGSNKATSKDQSMTMASSSGLSDKDIEKMLLMLNEPKLIRASQGLEVD